MKEYEIDSKTGERRVKPLASEQPAAKPLSAEQLQDKAYLRDLALRELAAIVMNNGGDVKGTNACNALLDRVEGKPVGTAPQISIGSNGGETRVQVILVNADQYRKEQEAKRVIEHQLNPIST